MNKNTGILYRAPKHNGGLQERVNVNMKDVADLRLVKRDILESTGNQFDQIYSQLLIFIIHSGCSVNGYNDYYCYWAVVHNLLFCLLVFCSVLEHYPCTEARCSHLCLPHRGFDRYTCACPTGIQDQTTCPPGIYVCVCVLF